MSSEVNRLRHLFYYDNIPFVYHHLKKILLWVLHYFITLQRHRGASVKSQKSWNCILDMVHWQLNMLLLNLNIDIGCKYCLYQGHEVKKEYLLKCYCTISKYLIWSHVYSFVLPILCTILWNMLAATLPKVRLGQ